MELSHLQIAILIVFILIVSYICYSSCSQLTISGPYNIKHEKMVDQRDWGLTSSGLNTVNQSNAYDLSGQEPSIRMLREMEIADTPDIRVWY
jgi:hypothetical protein